MMRMGTLGYYLGRMLAFRIGVSLLGFVALIQLLGVLDSATDILDRGLGLAGIGRFLWLRLPMALDQTLALSVLTGSVLTFSQLARRGEMVIIRSAGITIYRVCAMVLPVVVVVAAAHFMLNDRIVPRAQHALSVWWGDTALPDDEPDAPPDDGNSIWFRVSSTIVSVGAIRADGHELDLVRLYDRDANGALIRVTRAPRAVHANGVWTLADAEITTMAGLNSQRSGPADLAWNTNLDPRDMVDLGNPGGGLPSVSLRRILAGDGAANKPESYYRTRLAIAYAAPFASFVMLVLGLICAYGGGRMDRGERHLLVALALGLSFLLLNGILNAFGEAGALAPVLSAWAGLIIFACIAGTILLQYEEPWRSG